jgi:hypothetical protein
MVPTIHFVIVHEGVHYDARAEFRVADSGAWWLSDVKPWGAKWTPEASEAARCRAKALFVAFEAEYRAHPAAAALLAYEAGVATGEKALSDVYDWAGPASLIGRVAYAATPYAFEQAWQFARQLRLAIGETVAQGISSRLTSSTTEEIAR